MFIKWQSSLTHVILFLNINSKKQIKSVHALYNPHNVKFRRDKPLLDLFRYLAAKSHPTFSSCREILTESCMYHRARSRGVLNFSSARTGREQDAVSRDCSRLQLLAVCPVSRGGTTSDPWAMSAAMEAAGNHVSYRTVRQRPRERILACVPP